MPAQAPPVSDERSALVAYLVQQQDAFRAAIYGLSDAQAGLASAPPSTLTVGSLLKHVTQTQAHWLELSSNAKQIFTHNSSEYIQFDEPETLINAVREVYDQAGRPVAAHGN